MTTIRRQLTIWYSVALIASVAAFGLALFFELQKPSVRELDQRISLQASFAVNYLQESHRVLGRLTSDGPRPTLDPGIAAAFEGLTDYLVIADPTGSLLYLSPPTSELNFAAVERISHELREVPGARTGNLTLDSLRGSVRFLVRPVHSAGTEIGALLVATPRQNTSFDPGVLRRSMLFVSPLIILGSILLGYWLAARALSPVEGIMDELDAITDGRSLHRRLAVPRSGDEVARLALTVNGMLARLEQSFTGLRRFTADASHELKTPLMVLRAGVERSLTDPRTPADVMGVLDETLEQINRMSEMVENLLTLARADEGRAPIAVESCDLRELVAEASETAGILGDEAGVTVVSEMPETPVVLEVDRHRIRELLLNLVTNAVKYTPAGGTASLRLGTEPHGVVIEVRDSGIGIAPGDLPHIFERFWRADPARSRTGDRPGTGLGLAITKWIAEAHGGSITVQSRPRRGTTFTVILPWSPGQARLELRRHTPLPGTSHADVMDLSSSGEVGGNARDGTEP
jgi:two-component system, OmpR family, sensor kinase